MFSCANVTRQVTKCIGMSSIWLRITLLSVIRQAWNCIPAKVDLVHCRHTHFIKFHWPACTLYIVNMIVNTLNHHTIKITLAVSYELTDNDYWHTKRNKSHMSAHMVPTIVYFSGLTQICYILVRWFIILGWAWANSKLLITNLAHSRICVTVYCYMSIVSHTLW